jgi:CHAD domain-containing protein
MNSIGLVQSNVDSLPPPNSENALQAKSPPRGSPLPLSHSPDLNSNQPADKQLRTLLPGQTFEGLGLALGETLLARWKSYQERVKECRDRPTLESVHELRVAIRRLISQFMLFSQMLPEHTPQKARNILKSELESLGTLRDSHVQRIFLQRQATKFPGLAALLKRLEREEAHLAKKASQNVHRFKSTTLEKAVASLLEFLKAQSRNGQTQRELANSALRCADGAFANVVERYRGIDRDDPRTIHRIRVAFKKFRYIVESFPPQLSGYSQSDLRALARYQRRMGNIQDFEVILQRVQGFLKQHQHARLDLFSGYLRARRTRAVQSFLTTSSRLLQFWPPQAAAGPVRRGTRDASACW